MEKVSIKFMLVAFMVMAATNQSFAIWQVVTDPHCLKAVTTNLATQKAIEGQHNHRLDSIASKKKKLELYTVSMATIKELYKLTLENVKGFGTESKYYVEIGRCAYDIIRDVPELVQTVNRAKFSNKLSCLNELGNLVVETQQLVGDFVNIVNNAKIGNPLKGQGTAKKQGDGHNMLDRCQPHLYGLDEHPLQGGGHDADGAICHPERPLLCHRPGRLGKRGDNEEPSGWTGT